MNLRVSQKQDGRKDLYNAMYAKLIGQRMKKQAGNN